MTTLYPDWRPAIQAVARAVGAGTPLHYAARLRDDDFFAKTFAALPPSQRQAVTAELTRCRLPVPMVSA